MSPLLGKRVRLQYSTEDMGTVVGLHYDRKESRWDILVLRDDGNLSSYWHDSVTVVV